MPQHFSPDLEKSILIIEDAAVIRHARLNNPEAEVDETTVEDVTEALLRHGASPSDALRHRGPLTRALRIMLKGIDQQR